MPISSSEGTPISRGSGIDWENLGAGALGAADEALFGIPEFIAKKVDRKGVQDYIDRHAQAYHTGEAVGTVGSMFVPLPGIGLLKGATGAAKLAKGADTALDVARLAGGAEKATKAGIDWAKLAKLAKTGAISGAAEAGVRGVTSEKKPQDILKDIATGGAFGAAGGLAGGAISEGLKKVGKKAGTYADEASKIRKQYMEGAAGLTGRDTRQILKEYAGQGAKGLGRFEKAEDALSQVDRIIKEGELYKIGGDDKYFAMVNKHWDDINNAADAALGKNVKGSDLFAGAVQRGAKDINELSGASGEKVKGMLENIAQDSSGYQGVHEYKKYLDNLYKDTFNDALYPKSADKQAARDAVGLLRRNVDGIVADAAEAAGMDPAIINERKKNYIFDRALGESFARQITKPKTMVAGSQTAMRQAAQIALLGGAGYATGDTDTDRLQRMAGGLALGAGADVLGGVLNRAVNKGATKLLANSDVLIRKLQAVAPKIEKIAGRMTAQGGAIVGGGAGAIIGTKAVQEARPTTPTEQSAAEAGASAGTGNQPAYMSKVLDQMKAFAAANGVSEQDPQFGQFVQEVYAMTGGFAPDKIGSILYKDPAELAAYNKALSTSRRLSEVMPTATQKAPGLFSGETKEQKIERLAAVDQLASIVGDVAKEKGSEAAAKKSLNIILTGNEPPERKSELVKMLLLSYGVDLDQLSQMGVV